MDFTSITKSNTKVLSNDTKVLALETSLHLSLVNFQELVLDLQQLHRDSENYKQQYLSVKDKCENQTCMASEELRKIIATKDLIIQTVASTLTKLNETKDFNILAEAFKLLFEEVAPLTPPSDDTSPKSDPSDNSNKAVSPINKNITPCEADSITEDVSFQEESLCEIDGTPTGRKSPIIHIRQTKSKFSKSDLAKTEVRDKKKCPDDWPTPESKAVKLVFPLSGKCTPKGSGKLRQSRLKVVTMKTSAVVDLTCSPEVLAQIQDQQVQPLIKKESVENDTILPSPTSGPTNYTLFKITSKASPSKFKKPKILSLKSRCENVKQDENRDTSNNVNTTADMDESINILNQFANRLRDIKKENSVQKDSPVRKESTPVKREKGTLIKKEMASVNMDAPDEDATSVSLLDMEQLGEDSMVLHSPSKRPLAENINIMNTPPKNDAESSMSILRPEPKTAALKAVTRKLPDLMEPVYKEPTVRKKAEKRNLQGWSCEECMNFYGVLYKDDPMMLAKKVDECSKHRGRHNPARPRTPPNFWNPRWTVPEDTEELNRMNNS